jgi:GT2 family glycosyltransferase
MTLNLIPKSPRPILAVLVLYGRIPSVSQSLRTLITILDANPDLAKHFSLVIYDNSPQPQNPEITDKIPVLYRHDRTNPGLASAYNFALAHAEKERHEWLLLLDQDTLLTQEFIVELIECMNSLRNQEKVASITPKLLVRGKIYSPAAHFIDQLRHQYRRSNHAVTREIVGVQPGRMGAYNSGATLRVWALRSIGGFPKDYWLDYLDHAVFHALSVHGYLIYVMRVEIEHDASQAAVTGVPAERQRNLISAQTRFVRQTGNFIDRLLYRVWLLRNCRILWIHHPDRHLWKDTAIQALTLKSQGRKLSGDGPEERDS